MPDAEWDSWFSGQWRPAPLSHHAVSFVGPFSVLLVLEGLTKATPFTWDNGSLGAAVIISFSISVSSAALPRHAVFGQILSALVAYAVGRALPFDSVQLVRTALAVGLSSLVMKLLGISYPPGGATAYIISHENVAAWNAGHLFWYLLFPLVTGTVVLIGFTALLENVVLKRRYPQMWM